MLHHVTSGISGDSGDMVTYGDMCDIWPHMAMQSPEHSSTNECLMTP
jgi:hypothetical protein